MPIPQNKDELLNAIKDSFSKLHKDYENIPNDLTRIDKVEGNVKNTQISVCDTLSYLIGWSQLVLKWYDKKSKNEQIDFPETNYKWNELGKLAQKFYADYVNWSFQDLLNEHKKVNNDILNLIDSLSNDELYQVNWYKQYTLGRMIQFNTSSPNQNVRKKIRNFKTSSYFKMTILLGTANKGFLK
ncbi:ClbS/DfsB family four-helix bundle protein [Arcobacter sp.]|uniref:ClbS/DfsB family four-helix bundle protein n=1 Tax=unclassified Arcobacter TaxID=2593671 RepID=UPI003AFFC101